MIILISFFVTLAIYHVAGLCRPSLPREETALARVVAPWSRCIVASLRHLGRRLRAWLNDRLAPTICEYNSHLIQAMRDMVKARERLDSEKPVVIHRLCGHFDRAPRYCDECAGEISRLPPRPRSLPSDGSCAEETPKWLREVPTPDPPEEKLT